MGLQRLECHKINAGQRVIEFSAPFKSWSLPISKHTSTNAGGFGSGDGELVCVDVGGGGWTCVAQFCSGRNHVHTV